MIPSKQLWSLKEEDIFIAKALEGDTRAFGMIVEYYQHMVFTICLQILKSREPAEEAAQDTFVKVYRHLHRFEKRSSFITWLYRIAYRSAIDYTRQNKIMQNASTEIEDGTFERMADDQPNAEQQLEWKDRESIIRQAIDELNAEDALVVTLYYLEEKNIKEIAGILNLTESNIKIKLFRSRSRMREILSRVREKF